MKLGIIGLPQTGKKSLFELLTGNSLPSAADPSKTISGTADIRDVRFTTLVRMFEPKKEVPARIDLELLPRIEHNTIREGSIFRDIADMDALCHVVRVFQDDSIYHLEGSVNPGRDIDFVNNELVLHDLIFIEKRQERIEKSRRAKTDKTLDIEDELLVRMKSHLEKELPLRTFELSSDEEKIVASYPFITRMKMLLVLNVSDDQAADDKLLSMFKEKYNGTGIDVMRVSVRVEREIESLESESEKKEFMEAMGITDPALNVLSRLAMKSLGLMSFFTVGKDEVRQWLIRQGSTAPVAAGAIHTDIQRGFIRAEVMKYADMLEYGSEEALKKAGKFLLMGKDYIVEDGDIVHFRFNV